MTDTYQSLPGGGGANAVVVVPHVVVIRLKDKGRREGRQLMGTSVTRPG